MPISSLIQARKKAETQYLAQVVSNEARARSQRMTAAAATRIAELEDQVERQQRALGYQAFLCRAAPHLHPYVALNCVLMALRNANAEGAAQCLSCCTFFSTELSR